MATMYWIGDSGGDATWTYAPGPWSNSSGGASNGSFPNSTTDVVFDSNSGNGDCYVTAANCKTLTIAAGCNTTFPLAETVNVYGDVNLSGSVASVTNLKIYVGSGATCNLTSGGRTIYSLTVTTNSIATLQDDLVVTQNITFNSGGTLSANNKHVSIGGQIMMSAGTLNMGAGTWTLSGTGTVWNVSGGTVNPDTSTINFTNNSSTQKTFAGGSKTYYNFWNATTGTGKVLFTGANTFNEFKSDAGRTNRFTAGTTTTATTWTISGTAGSLVTLESSTTSAFTLAKAGGGTVSLDYMSISYCTASPASFYAGENSTNGGNNTGWVFTAPPKAGFFAFF
jgi:hypothetical protein